MEHNEKTPIVTEYGEDDVFRSIIRLAVDSAVTMLRLIMHPGHLAKGIFLWPNG